MATKTRRLTAVPFVAALVLGCGDDSEATYPDGATGAVPAAPGGSNGAPPPSVGGLGSGGLSGVGGAAVGGVAGGSAGGVAVGGAGTGGGTAATTGGMPSAGGSLGSGGSAAMPSTGGQGLNTGGTEALGGTGGLVAGGGIENTGGVVGTGGATATGGNSAESPGCGQSAPTGLFAGNVVAFGLDRTYLMSVPTDYDPSVPHRLVFGFHGSNYTGELMRTYLDLEQPPLAEGTLFVYPDGIPLDDQPDHIAWELGEDERDIAFFDALFSKISTEYCIDLDRVFANGQSFGALMTNAVGCLRGDVLRAIAVVAGSGPRGTTCRDQVAVWITHGVDDESIAFSSGEASRDFWLAANHCADTTTVGDPAQCQNYDGCDPGYPVIWCPHEGDSGHQHPSFGREAVREFLDSF